MASPVSKLVIVGPGASTKLGTFSNGALMAADIRTLPHPRYPGRSIQFLVAPGAVMELQRVEPERQGSLFVGQAVQSDGAIYVATRVDPGLLLLPRLRAAGQKFSLLAQLLSEELPSHGQQGRRESGPSSSASSKSGNNSNEMDADGTHALARLFCKPPAAVVVAAASSGDDAESASGDAATSNEGGASASETSSPKNDAIALGLERLCDVKDLDDLGVFYRLNESKVEAWLKGKVTRIARHLETSAAADRERLGGLTGSGFVAGFTLGTTPTQAPKPPLPQVAHTTSGSGGSGESNGGAGALAEVTAANVAIAVELLCEYLTESSAATLRNYYAPSNSAVASAAAAQAAATKEVDGSSSPTTKRPLADPADAMNVDANSNSGASSSSAAAAKWNARSDADEMQALAFGVPKKAKTGDAAGGGSSSGGAKTNSNKALAKTSTKGMKSMASFFGAKKK